MHRRTALRQVSWLFREKTRVLRQSGVIDSRLLTIRLRLEEDECRFYIYDEARHSVPGLYLLDKSEFYLTLSFPNLFLTKAFPLLAIS